MSAEAKALRMLVVGDREDDALLLVRLLQREGYAVRWLRVDERDALRETVEGEPRDVVVCDFRMPGFDARQALEVVRAHDPDMPLVVVSGTVGEDAAVEMMRAGANDYVMKDNLARLPAAVTRELREAEERRARRWAEAQLRRLSLTVEQGPGIVVVTNARGRVEYVNRRFTEVTGFEPQDVVGMPAYLLAEPLEPAARAALQEALGSGAWWRARRWPVGRTVAASSPCSRSARPGIPTGAWCVTVDDARLVEGLRRANLELQLAYDATLEGWSRALDLRVRDRDTEGHTHRRCRQIS